MPALDLNRVVHYVSAPCGVGKTYAACQFIRDNRFHANHLYVAPSRTLIAETQKTLRGFGLDPMVITSDTNPNHAKASIVEFMNQAEDTGEILLITWNAYVDLPYLNRRENWQVIIDEVPQLDRFYGWRLPRNLTFLTDYLDVEDSAVNDKVARVTINDSVRLEERLEAVRDDVEELFREFFRDLLSHNKETFVDLESWNRLVESKTFSDDENLNRLFFISMLRPGAFHNAILLGANIRDSMVYHWLTRFHGYRFVEHAAIKSQLRSFPVDTGSRLMISYFIPRRHASKSLYQKTATTGVNLLDEMDRMALESFGSQPFLYVANNKRKSILDDQAKATKIPVVSHGLNRYGKFSNIYFSAALNREPRHFDMLKALGFDSEHVHAATAHEVLYQCVLRTSLRDPDSTATVHAIIPDEPSARRLAQLAGATEVKQLGSLYVPAPKPLTPTQKDQRHEARKIIDALSVPRIQPFSFINGDGWNLGTFLQSDLNDVTEPEESKGGNPFKCFVTLHRNPRAEHRQEFVSGGGSVHSFIAFLRGQHRAAIDTKEEAVLFNPCIFEPPQGADGYRRKDYFKSSSCMVLDFDDGDLSPEAFEKIFWSEAGRGRKRSFVICNSFSRCEAKPNKFRVILFYKKPATKLTQHVAVYDAIVARLQKNGYTAASAKLDPACKSGVQSFYLPCTNRAHQDWAFFVTRGTKTRDLERCAIDPAMYEKTAVVTCLIPRLAANSIVVANATPGNIDAITANLRSMNEGRNHEIFRTGLNLGRLGLSPNEIEAELNAVVGREPHMRKKIPGVIKSLRKYGRL